VLSDIWKPKKTTFAEIRVREAEWPRSDTRKGEMATYLESLVPAEVILHVVRAFVDPLVGAAPTPGSDLDTLDHELVLFDLLAIERVFDRAKKQPIPDPVRNLLVRCQGVLENETPLRSMTIEESDLALIRGYGFRTLIPQVIVVNTPAGGAEAQGEIASRAAGREVVAFPFSEAAEVATLAHEEQREFAEALGLPGPPAEIVTRAVFAQMGLISFFTVGEDEVRAWPIRRGANARKAAGVIHSDLERGFIRAETVSYEEFVARGDMKGCRDAGTLRLEGKDYVVADGDIVHVRFNA
jgi:ribosome-binding ATPase YchF (GTP1/OBG family)